jgi:hypothetical protein
MFEIKVRMSHFYRKSCTCSSKSAMLHYQNKMLNIILEKKQCIWYKFVVLAQKFERKNVFCNTSFIITGNIWHTWGIFISNYCLLLGENEINHLHNFDALWWMCVSFCWCMVVLVVHNITKNLQRSKYEIILA